MRDEGAIPREQPIRLELPLNEHVKPRSLLSDFLEAQSKNKVSELPEFKEAAFHGGEVPRFLRTSDALLEDGRLADDFPHIHLVRAQFRLEARLRVELRQRGSSPVGEDEDFSFERGPLGLEESEGALEGEGEATHHSLHLVDVVALVRREALEAVVLVVC